MTRLLKIPIRTKAEWDERMRQLAAQHGLIIVQRTNVSGDHYCSADIPGTDGEMYCSFCFPDSHCN